MNERRANTGPISLPVLSGGDGGGGSDGGALEARLRERVRGDIRFGHHDRMLYATDASIYQVEPLGVVIPETIDDAAEAVRLCAEYGVPVLPRGGGTSLAGQCTNRAVVIDLSRHCGAVRSVDVERGRCVVEPGITIDDLNTQLAPTGWFFAPDPATGRHACIGGCIGNNAAGARSIRYGRTSEGVLAIDACLADGSRVRFGEATNPRSQQGGGLSSPRHLASATASIVSRHAHLIRDRFPKTIRRNAGYALDMILAQLDAGISPEAVNLAPLLCGSEGTLAFTLGAELQLHRIPAARGLAVVAFASLDGAIDAVVPILETNPTAVELLDDMVIGLARANLEYRCDVELLPRLRGGEVRAVLYVEYSAERDPAELGESFDALRRIVRTDAIATHTHPQTMLRAWALRKAGEPLLHGIAGDRKPVTFVEDNAVPVERLGEFVRRFRAIVHRHGTTAAFFAHASVGVLHVRPLIDPHAPADRAVMHAIAVEAADLAKELGGVMSGEHGDGKVRSPLLEGFYGPELVAAMREVKTLFDPRNLLNPGNIVEPAGFAPVDRRIESISERTRIEPDGVQAGVPRVWTHFRFADQHGFGGAVEMCNGAGVCRKRSGGTMCPSFQATLDERHSTRGRGNALRLAITGQFALSAGATGRRPVPVVSGGGGARGSEHWTSSSGTRGGVGWNDPETLATLDLCLSCKACKAECPSNVDIARLKAEYLAQSYLARGRAPLDVRIMGDIRTVNRLGSLAPGVANAAARSALGRAMALRLLGVDRRRTLPAFARSLAARVDSGVVRRPSRLPSGAPAVVLFGDCFTMFSEPGIGLAAVRLLRAFGYAVGLADAGCCGRSKISLGLLGEASRTIPRTAERLMAWVRDPRVRAVLVLEPSCQSAICDDWLDLRSAAPAADLRAIAAKTMSVEAFLERGWEEHPRRPEWHGSGWHGSPSRGSDPHASESPATSGQVVYHGHCHSKALWGVESETAILRRVLNESRLGELSRRDSRLGEPCHQKPCHLEVLDTGCCGMAGAFGYAAHRYDLSMKIGEQVLMPAVRGRGEGAAVLAPGTSCRHQIADATGVRAVHPVEWLAVSAK